MKGLPLALVKPSFYSGTRGRGHGSCGGLRGGRPPRHQNTQSYVVPRQHTSAYGGDHCHPDCDQRQVPSEVYYSNWCGIGGHRLRDCPAFTVELRKRAAVRKGQLTVNAAVVGASSDEPDSDLDDFKDKLGLPYLPDNLAADLIELNLAKPKAVKRAPWILDSGASTSVTGDVNAVRDLQPLDTKAKVTTVGGRLTLSLAKAQLYLISMLQ